MIRIYPSKISGKLKAPASKAHALRLLYMASMPAFPTTIKNVPDCDDVDTAFECLKNLGCEITPGRNAGDYVIKPFPKTTPLLEADFDFMESATTARLSIVLCSILAIKADCKAHGTLPRRKLVQLTGKLAIRGVNFSSFSLPFSQSGRLAAGDFSMPGDEGSQSISALLMFLPCLMGDSTITLESPLLDKSFINITINSLEKFKIHVQETETGFFIPGKQFYQSPKNISAENDWGLASMWITAAAACGPNNNLTLEGLSAKSPQLYRDIAPMLSLISQDFTDINIDASNIPNLTPLLCALAIVKGATIRINGVPQLKYKETNQFKTLAEIARAFGQDAQINEDGISIIGNGKADYPEDLKIDCQGDPWVFMAMVLASSMLKKPIVLSDEHGADKIYRNFLNDFKSIGGKFDII